MAMLTKREFQKLIMQHGPVIYYLINESSRWYPHKEPASQYQPGMNSMQAMYALRFKDKVEWDEINGIRK